MASTPGWTGFVSLGVIASAALVALGWQTGDPIVGLLITLVILKVTSDSWRIIRAGAHDHVG
jgi:divalent metal cation (Fe/Co/Zn/Cd) transporter